MFEAQSDALEHQAQLSYEEAREGGPPEPIVARPSGRPGGARRRGSGGALAALDRGPLLAILAAVGLYIWLSFLEPDALSYNGFNLSLSSAIPLLFTTVAEMLVISLGDLDLGAGYALGLTNSLSAYVLSGHELLGLGALALLVVAYALMGALVQWRYLPAIIVTLGASFIWLGIGLIVAPTPGGASPSWLTTVSNWSPPWVPFPILVAVVVAAIGTVVVVRLRSGVALRAVGSNSSAARFFGVSVMRVRVTAYTLAGLSIVIGGLLLTGMTQSGDPTSSANYTLLAVAAVILGGGEFRGGKASVIGAVCGAFALSLVTSVLSVLNVASSLQTGAEGVVLIVVIAGRRLLQRWIA